MTDQAPYETVSIVRRSNGSIITLTDDVTRVSIRQDIGYAYVANVTLLNFDDSYSIGGSDEIARGDTIYIHLGYEPGDTSTDKVFGGLVYAVTYDRNFLIVEALDWTAYLIGPKLTRNYVDFDTGEVIRNIIESKATLMDTDYLLDTGYIFDGEYKMSYSETLEAVSELSNYSNFRFFVDADKRAKLVPTGYQLSFIDGFNNYTATSSSTNIWEHASGSFGDTEGVLSIAQSGVTMAYVK